MLFVRLGIAGLLWATFALLGCSGSDSADAPARPNTDAGTDAAVDANDDAPTEASPPDAADEDAQDAAAPVTLTLPQAVGGALFANPEVYPEIPLRVLAEGFPEQVAIDLAGNSVAASDDDEDGTWEAMIPIASSADGTFALQVRATTGGVEVGSVSAELRIGRQGVQRTDFATDGPAGTPRLHRKGAQAWMTWTDRSSGSPDAWLHEIDGAGRWVGDRVSLIGPTSEPALYARTALGFDYVGVLYQSLDMPYRTHFRVVDHLGNAVVDTIDLDPPNTSASFGGDITFDGSAFVVVWRVKGGAGTSRVLWQRIDPNTQQVTGPSIVAESGNDDPTGGFEPFSFVKVATLGTVSMVTFVRGRWSTLLDISVPKAQVTRVLQSGAVDGSWFLGNENDFTWHREARVTRMGQSFLLLWSSSNLNDPSPNPPNLFQAMLADAQGAFAGAPLEVFDAVDDRDEPFVLTHPDHFGTLAWLDHRAYTLDPQHGRIELYVAPMADTLQTQSPTVFPHARFVAGLAQLNGANAGTNALLTWIDQRHGSGIADPKPEVWFETAWF